MRWEVMGVIGYRCMDSHTTGTFGLCPNVDLIFEGSNNEIGNTVDK
jgi:hypothetical protein